MHTWRGESSDPLPWDEVVTKFRRLVAPVIKSDDQDRVIETVAGIETANAKVLADVLSAAVAAGRTAGK